MAEMKKKKMLSISSALVITATFIFGGFQGYNKVSASTPELLTIEKDFC